MPTNLSNKERHNFIGLPALDLYLPPSQAVQLPALKAVKPALHWHTLSVVVVHSPLAAISAEPALHTVQAVQAASPAALEVKT